jgi:signal transduction histidine kinase
VDAAEASYTFAALLPVRPGSGPSGALVVVGDQRDPFAALDNRFLTALAEQVGAALEATAMASGLAQRTKELERLSALMLRQHEDERRRFARELHDESAQVLAAVKMELGMLRERLAPDDAVRLEDTIALLNGGIRGIRAVARDLRPALLDDLGLVPALRSLADDFRERSGLAVNVTLPDPERIPPLSRDAELAVFRALQEALANVARHASAETIDVRVNVTPEGLTLAVHDDGRGLGPAGGQHDGDDGVAHVGLAGMRERLAALGGTMTVADRREGGAALTIRLPASPPA